MAKTNVSDMLKRRMTATQQASELQTSDEAYQQIFREKVPIGTTQLCELPLDKRQGLSIIERGKAYRALLDAKNRHGQSRYAAYYPQVSPAHR